MGPWAMEKEEMVTTAHLLLRFQAPNGERALVVEDDDRVAYADRDVFQLGTHVRDSLEHEHSSSECIRASAVVDSLGRQIGDLRFSRSLIQDQRRNFFPCSAA